MELSADIREQIKAAFRTMTTELGSDAPSDADMDEFVKNWWAEEDSLTFRIGRADYNTCKATIFAIEAAPCVRGVLATGMQSEDRSNGTNARQSATPDTERLSDCRCSFNTKRMLGGRFSGS